MYMRDTLSTLPVHAGPRAWALFGDMSATKPHVDRFPVGWVVNVTKGIHKGRACGAGSPG